MFGTRRPTSTGVSQRYSRRDGWYQMYDGSASSTVCCMPVMVDYARLFKFTSVILRRPDPRLDTKEQLKISQLAHFLQIFNLHVCSWLLWTPCLVGSGSDDYSELVLQLGTELGMLNSYFSQLMLSWWNSMIDAGPGLSKHRRKTNELIMLVSADVVCGGLTCQLPGSVIDNQLSGSQLTCCSTLGVTCVPGLDRGMTSRKDKRIALDKGAADKQCLAKKTPDFKPGHMALA